MSNDIKQKNYSYMSVSKNAVSGAIQGAMWSGAATLYELHKNKAAIKIVKDAKDNFETSNVLKKVSSDSVKNVDTYFVNGTKNTFIYGKRNAKIGYNSAMEALQNGTKTLKQNAPKLMLKNAAVCGALLAGVAFVYNNINKLRAKKSGK